MLTGRYTGAAARWRLDLRVDPGTPPVPGRVSGDLFETAPGERDRYRLSFAATLLIPTPGSALDTPVAVTGNPAYAAGRLRLAPLEATTVRANLALTRTDGGPDDALAVEVEGQGPWLRSVTVATFVVPGAEPPDSPLLATVREPGTTGDPGPQVTLATAMERAGVRLGLAPPRVLPVAGAGTDATWSDAELHDALAALRDTGVPDPRDPWLLHLLIATRGERPRVLGVMFDTGASGAGRAAAVFHDAVKEYDRVRGDPEAFAREFLFTCAHELGHLLSLPHAWEAFGGVGPPERGRTALTFMNYPHLYARGYRRFYESFRFAFRHEELLHLRHAPWHEIRPWGRDAAAGPAPLMAAAPPGPRSAASRLQLEARVAGAPRFRFGEPVHLEVKLTNLSRRRVHVPADVLDAAGGALRVFVSARGKGREAGAYHLPILARDDRAPRIILGGQGGGPASEPLSACYATVDVTYGRSGFTFIEPGEYDVRLAACLLDGSVLWSEPLGVGVDPPLPREERWFADLLTPAMGRAIVLGGDPEGAELFRLRELAERGEPAGLVPWAALRVGQCQLRGFKRVTGARSVPADPGSAAGFLRLAIERGGAAATFPNPVFSGLLQACARSHALSGRPDAARGVLRELERFVRGTVRSNTRLRTRLLHQVGRFGASLQRGGGP